MCSLFLFVAFFVVLLTAPLVCQRLGNEPPRLSQGASNRAQRSDTTTCWGWKLYNKKKKKMGLKMES